MREGGWGLREEEEKEGGGAAIVVEEAVDEASQCHSEPSWEQLNRLLGEVG